jgi:hypothetical protein
MLAFFFVSIFCFSAANSVVATAASSTSSAASPLECPLYLAPSLVKGGGKGIFVGSKVRVGKTVGQSEGLIIDDYLVQGTLLHCMQHMVFSKITNGSHLHTLCICLNINVDVL